MSFTFSSKNSTSGLELTNNNRTATNRSLATGWEIAVCEICTEAKSFKVRIEKNPQQRDLYIGFTQLSEALQLDVVSASHNSWLIDIGNQQLYERGLNGPCGRGRVEIGSIVTVEKDFTHCALRFYVNGEDLQDKNSKPYGWRPTGLSQANFDTLTGCVWLFKIGNEVSIVD